MARFRLIGGKFSAREWPRAEAPQAAAGGTDEDAAEDGARLKARIRARNQTTAGTAPPKPAPGPSAPPAPPDAHDGVPPRRPEAGITPLDEPQWPARLPLMAGLVALGVLIGGFGLWSVQARIAGAVVAPGRIEVESNRQVIQHPQGGVVGAIMVKDGDRVAAGQVLLTLDGSRTRSELAIVEGQLRELAARRARLRAERDGSDSLPTPADLPAWIAGDPGFAGQMASERQLFKARLDALHQQAGLIDEQNAQIRNRIAGTAAELQSAQRQAALVDDALADQQKLLSQGLAQSSRVLTLRTQQETLIGQAAQLQAKVAELKGQIAGNDIQKLQLSTKRREDAVTQLRDIQFKEVALAEKRLSLKDTLSRLDIRAPVAGIVYDSKVFAVHSVVQPAEPLMYIIPQDQPLIVAARIDGVHIDAVHVGQQVSLRFPAFDQRTTGPVPGTLVRISADTLTDPTTHQGYYAATIEPDKVALAKLRGHKLVPGMPAQAFIETGNRSPLSYLLHPLAVYFDKAFRE